MLTIFLFPVFWEIAASFLLFPTKQKARKPPFQRASALNDLSCLLLFGLIFFYKDIQKTADKMPLFLGA